ncbi:Membrane protein involved in the export of O-antigen and teichoic acid [Algoriphagus faecimaris]|uniref:Membrane protein involved in the export of O-antigen and teichoic acid n=1 Tax=Algoriphagus faecimaris TaxID=686796 RepID=A0A1G6UB91_9BACT|nr:hypothetical protein [Algoriphagus faecimaris]SDD38660.1 Membrane protein involved in the export of O-antigen and teichoic acid [Algoriphagus faecimaris]
MQLKDKFISLKINKVVQNFSSNSFAQAITLGIQIVSVPLLLTVFGMQLYGEWVLLSSIPAYLTFSNLGITQIAGNELALAEAKGDAKQFSLVLRNAFLLTCTLVFGVSVVFLLCIWLLNPQALLNIKSLEKNEVAWILSALVMYTAISLVGGIFMAVLRGKGKYAQGTFLANISRGVEFLIVISAAWWSRSLLVMALSYLCLRIIITFLWVYSASKYEPNLLASLRMPSYNKHLIRRLALPSISSMGFPLGNAINIQGINIIIGVVFGATTLAAFNVYRVIANMVKQLVNTVSHSFYPEITFAYGKKDSLKLRFYIKKSQFLSIAIAVSCFLGLLILEEFILKLWTQNEIPYDFFLCNLLNLSAVIYATWYSNYTASLAINKHMFQSLLYLVLAILTIVIFYSLTFIFESLVIISMSLIIIEFVMYINSSKRIFIK